MFARILRAPVLFFDTNPIGEALSIYSVKVYNVIWKYAPASNVKMFLQKFL